MGQVLLAIDQGSSSSRCVVLDAALRVAGAASAPLATSFPAPGWVEHDPAEIVTGVLAAAGQALAIAGATWPDVAGIGLAAQTETFVVWDRASGQAIYPAISWRDTRTAADCARLRAAGHEPLVRARTGLPLEPAFCAPKLRWVLDQVPGAAAAAAAGRLAFGDVNSWLIWQLSGGVTHVTDPSMAARTMLFDLAGFRWDAELLELFGIPPHLLPQVQPTAGALAVTYPSVTGGRAVITASVGDQQAGLFGQRCFREGMAKLTLGTGAFLWCHAGSRPPSAPPAGVVASCAWQVGGERAYALEGFVPNAGGVTTWLRQLGVLAPGAWPRIRPGALAELADQAGRLAPGDASLADAADRGARAWCVPALFGLGTPSWHPAALAEIGGLTADSTGADIAEAALLGVVHQIADAIDAVRSGLTRPLDLVRVDGGLARNDSVVQAVADLCGVVLERPAQSEATALGAGALAGIGAGLWDQAALAALPFEAGPAVSPALADGHRETARAIWQEQLASALSRWQEGRPR